MGRSDNYNNLADKTDVHGCRFLEILQRETGIVDYKLKKYDNENMLIDVFLNGNGYVAK